MKIAVPARRENLKSGSRNVQTSKQSYVPPAHPEPVPRATSANSSSKKRAKARQQGNLAAVLANRNLAASTSGIGFDLMDFMKKV